jgi:hypothetical protein
VLCCLNLQAHKISTFQPKCEVRKMHWVGRRVLYWTGSVSPSKVIVDKRPHGWSPP